MYESKIYIVAPTTQYNKELGKVYAETIATFKLGYVDPLQNATEDYKPTKYYIYADDGETEILKDNYGDELRELTIDQLICHLTYTNGLAISRKACLLLSTLYAIKKTYYDGDLVCLHYGY